MALEARVGCKERRQGAQKREKESAPTTMSSAFVSPFTVEMGEGPTNLVMGNCQTNRQATEACRQCQAADNRCSRS